MRRWLANKMSVAAAPPVPTCEQHFQSLHAACGAVIRATFAADTQGRQAAALGLVPEMTLWLEALGSRPERSVLTVAIREYESGLLSLAQGHYRTAFAELRLFLELAVTTVQFGTNRLELKEWLDDVEDIKWRSLLDDKNGVFSERFSKAFFLELGGEMTTYREMARKVYQECSDFVHGAQSTNALVPQTVTFDAHLFDAWHSKANVITLVVFFTFCLRYLRELTRAERAKLEPAILRHLGHLNSIKSEFVATVTT
jgi:hypothetical protein